MRKLLRKHLPSHSYMAKPVDHRQSVEVIRTINAYWTFSEVPL